MYMMFGGAVSGGLRRRIFVLFPVSAGVLFMDVVKFRHNLSSNSLGVSILTTL